MTLQGHYSLRASIMPSSLSGDVEDPDERTSIVIGRNPMNYQSTETTSNLRNRQSPSQTETSTVDQNRTTAHNTEEKRGLLDYLGGVWSIELENKGSVARDHLALGMFSPPYPYPLTHVLGIVKLTCRALPCVYRTYIPCLAADISRIRFDRDSDHPTVSPQLFDIR
jgi:hypothetical protein